MKENEKGEIYEYCMKQYCCKVCKLVEECPFEERNKISSTNTKEEHNTVDRGAEKKQI